MRKKVIVIVFAVVLLVAIAAGVLYVTGNHPAEQDAFVTALEKTGSLGGVFAFEGSILNTADRTRKVHIFFYGVGKNGVNVVWPDGDVAMSIYSGSIRTDRKLTPKMITEGWAKTDTDGLAVHGEECTIYGHTTNLFRGAIPGTGFSKYYLWIFDESGTLLHERRFS